QKMRSYFLLTLMALAAFTFILTLQQAQSATLSFLMPENAKGFVLYKSAVAKRQDTFAGQVTEQTEMPGDQETTKSPEDNSTEGPQKRSSEGLQEGVSGATTEYPESTTENEITTAEAEPSEPKARSVTEPQKTQEPSEAVSVDGQKTTTAQPSTSELYTDGVDTVATEETGTETTEALKSTIPPNPTDFRSQGQETEAPIEGETEIAKSEPTILLKAEGKTTTEAPEIATNQTEFTDENVTEAKELKEA
ncbi:hypothetical protein DOY81_009116, partial [Sarcophaga bullata]